MARNRGRDVSISKRSLPLNTTGLMGITPLGVPFASPPVITPSLSRPAKLSRLLPDITPQPKPANRMAKTATRTNLYQPQAVAKEVSTCQNRSIRKQVLFATGNSGRNGMKTARYTNKSKVKCK